MDGLTRGRASGRRLRLGVRDSHYDGPGCPECLWRVEWRDLRWRRQVGNGMVSEVADRAVLVWCMLAVPNRHSCRRPDQHDRQDGDTRTPIGATSHRPLL